MGNLKEGLGEGGTWEVRDFPGSYTTKGDTQVHSKVMS